jgi:outer membrane protein assembly factor BamE (lipoprotein component of BamABCDE complex)
MSLLSGCRATVGQTRQLSPGMSAAQVQSILGEPSQTQFVSDKWIWKYSLAKWGTDNIPYYLIFNKDTQTLEQWAANEAEFVRNQQMLMQTWGMLNQTFPPTQKSKVEVKIKRK